MDAAYGEPLREFNAGEIQTKENEILKRAQDPGGSVRVAGWAGAFFEHLAIPDSTFPGIACQLEIL